MDQGRSHPGTDFLSSMHSGHFVRPSFLRRTLATLAEFQGVRSETLKLRRSHPAANINANKLKPQLVRALGEATEQTSPIWGTEGLNV